MKLYYSPGACSLSPHIVLHEAGLEHEIERVDLKSKVMADGGDYWAVNGKGSVPALQLDNGELLTEGVAIVQYIADQVPEKAIAPKAGTMERYRLQEMLNYIATDVHKGFSPIFNPAFPDEVRAVFKENVLKKYAYLDSVLAKKGPYLFGEKFTVADAYLYVTTRWARAKELEISGLKGLAKFIEAMEGRKGVQDALAMEEQAQKAA